MGIWKSVKHCVIYLHLRIFFSCIIYSEKPKQDDDDERKEGLDFSSTSPAFHKKLLHIFLIYQPSKVEESSIFLSNFQFDVRV